MVYLFLAVLALGASFNPDSNKKFPVRFLVTYGVLIASYTGLQYLFLVPENVIALLFLMLALSISAAFISFIFEMGESFSVVSLVLPAILLLSIASVSIYGMFSGNAKFEAVQISEESSNLPAFDEKSKPVSVPLVFAENKMRKSFGQVPNSSYYSLGSPQIQLLNGEEVYVAPIEFSTFTRWNKAKTSPGYFVLSAVDSSANPKFVKSEMSYTPSAYFGKDALRRIHSEFSGELRTEEMQFEVDEDGKPYFFISYGDYIAGNNGFTNGGILLLDPVNGSVEKFALNDVPEWIDAPVSSEVASQHNDFFGKYPHGFWNSIFGKQDVILTTDTGNENGLTPVFFEDEMFFFADFQSPKEGIDSMMAYTLTNARSGEVIVFRGNESSYMDSNGAQEVANKKFIEKQWTASVPMLYNFFGETSWFVSMVDPNGFLQQIVIVSAENPEISGSATSTTTALKQYKAALSGNVNQGITGDSNAETSQDTITVERSYKEKINNDQTAVYILATNGLMYVVSSELNTKVLFVEPGDQLTIEFNQTESGVFPILSIELPY